MIKFIKIFMMVNVATIVGLTILIVGCDLAESLYYMILGYMHILLNGYMSAAEREVLSLVLTAMPFISVLASVSICLGEEK